VGGESGVFRLVVEAIRIGTILNKLSTPPDRRQRSNGRETYTALLDSALAIWSEEGLDQVMMDAVARRAGRSRAIMYHHFKNRDDLIDALHAHLDDRMSHLFDLTKAASRNDYLMVAGLMVDSPSLIRSYLMRLIGSDPKQDPLMAIARNHYKDINNLGWLQPGMDLDHAAVISFGMWFASMLAVDLKEDVNDRRAEAFKFAQTFQIVMEKAVIKSAEERVIPSPDITNPT
jgi:AcrR family transcriptional regulator